LSALPYTREFFVAQAPGSLVSARVIVPIVMNVVGPHSVVDLGCGTGSWLSVFAEHGVVDSVGIDGHYVDTSALLIPRARFIAHDLRKSLTLDRQFDLAISLEVAEHLPDSSADPFVTSLVQLAPVVLFSAAVPGQGGIRHLNERWPSYWASRFAEHHYLAVDAIRPRVWENELVAWWYAQNTLLFVSASELEARPRLRSERERFQGMMDLVHPRMYEEAVRAWKEVTTRQLLKMLPAALARTFRWRFARPRS
jgi:SAM-dependent methyltransferase